MLTAAFLLAACEPISQEEIAARPPEGAVKVGPDFYVYPAGADPEGCPWYGSWSRELMVPQAMRYRREGGGWTFNKDEAACDAP